MITQFLIILLIYLFFVFLIYRKKYSRENLNPIPLNLFTNWHTKNLPPKMNEAFEKVKSQNPEFNIQLFDENDCKEYIEKNFPKEVLDAYLCLNPQAYKCDLWRYCVLYKEGGIYYDIKFVPQNGFKFISLTDKEYFFMDPIEDNPNKSTRVGVLNGIIVTKPNNERILNAINRIVKNTQERKYEKSPIAVSGPLLLGRFWTQKEIKDFEYVFRKPDAIMNKSTGNIILKMYDEYRDEQNKYGKGKHYGQYYGSRTMYNC